MVEDTESGLVESSDGAGIRRGHVLVLALILLEGTKPLNNHIDSLTHSQVGTSATVVTSWLCIDLYAASVGAVDGNQAFVWYSNFILVCKTNLGCQERLRKRYGSVELQRYLRWFA